MRYAFIVNPASGQGRHDEEIEAAMKEDTIVIFACGGDGEIFETGSLVSR